MPEPRAANPTLCLGCEGVGSFLTHTVARTRLTTKQRSHLILRRQPPECPVRSGLNRQSGWAIQGHKRVLGDRGSVGRPRQPCDVKTVDLTLPLPCGLCGWGWKNGLVMFEARNDSFDITFCTREPDLLDEQCAVCSSGSLCPL